VFGPEHCRLNSADEKIDLRWRLLTKPKLKASKMNLTKPDARYFVFKGQLWRCANLSLAEDV